MKYADFVTAGRTLTMRVEQTKIDERFVNLKFQGDVEGRVSVTGRLVLERYNLADSDPTQQGLDDRMIARLRDSESLLTRGVG